MLIDSYCSGELSMDGGTDTFAGGHALERLLAQVNRLLPRCQAPVALLACLSRVAGPSALNLWSASRSTMAPFLPCLP